MKSNNEILAMLVDKTRKEFEKYLTKEGFEIAYFDLNIILELSNLTHNDFKPLDKKVLIDRQSADNDCNCQSEIN